MLIDSLPTRSASTPRHMTSSNTAASFMRFGASSEKNLTLDCRCETAAVDARRSFLALDCTPKTFSSMAAELNLVTSSAYEALDRVNSFDSRRVVLETDRRATATSPPSDSTV